MENSHYNHVGYCKPWMKNHFQYHHIFEIQRNSATFWISHWPHHLRIDRVLYSLILVNWECKSCKYIPAIPHAFGVRLQQLPSPMHDMRLRPLPYFQNIFALIALTLYMSSWSKNCPNLNFHCPICPSHSIALLPGWQVWSWSSSSWSSFPSECGSRRGACSKDDVYACMYSFNRINAMEKMSVYITVDNLHFDFDSKKEFQVC